MIVEHFSTASELARVAAERIVEAGLRAVEARGRFHIALSGGTAPLETYRRLATLLPTAVACLPDRGEASLEDRTHVFWSDERFVPPADSASNEGAARRAWLDGSSIPKKQIFGMVSVGTPTESAIAYEQLFVELLGTPPILDLALLGMGEDGHTASLFPGNPSLDIQNRYVVDTICKVEPRERITFTYATLLLSRQIYLIVKGEGKRKVFDQALHDASLPIHRILVEHPTVCVLTDFGTQGIP
jgi:6-phosphogluconolactonase